MQYLTISNPYKCNGTGEKIMRLIRLRILVIKIFTDQNCIVPLLIAGVHVLCYLIHTSSNKSTRRACIGLRHEELTFNWNELQAWRLTFVREDQCICTNNYPARTMQVGVLNLQLSFPSWHHWFLNAIISHMRLFLSLSLSLSFSLIRKLWPRFTLTFWAYYGHVYDSCTIPSLFKQWL